MRKSKSLLLKRLGVGIEDEKEFSYNTEIAIDNFDTFYNFLDGDIYDAELEKYDFRNIDLRNYNINGAVISSDVLEIQELYDGTYFDGFKKRMNESIVNQIVMHDEDVCKEVVTYQIEIERNLDRINFFYISDIHLCHRINYHFKEKATQEEIKFYVKKLARQMVNSTYPPYNSYLLIAGDTSSDFEIAKVFYSEIAKQWWNKKYIIVISGNHELWDPYVTMEDNILQYRDFFNSIGVTYLHNELLCIEELEHNFLLRSGHEKKRTVLNEKQILECSREEIREVVKKCPIIILGGIGFSGLNKKYNATNMRYGKSFEGKTAREVVEKDIIETNKFNNIYEKVNSAISNNKVIVLTHMKKSDWNDDAYNPNWIYLNGHDHHNYYEFSKEKVIYADNQIGYKAQN